MAWCWLCSAPALLSKEQTVVLPALLLLTDYLVESRILFRAASAETGGCTCPCTDRRRWLVAFFWRLICSAQQRPASHQGLHLVSILLHPVPGVCSCTFGCFCCPVGLNADWDFPDLAHHPGSRRLRRAHRACAGWRVRRFITAGAFRWPATDSSLCHLMAPTSSFVPIPDPVAERRLYLSMIGLLLIVAGSCGA